MRRIAAPVGRDAHLLRHAARRIGIQTGALVFVAFCLCAGVLLFVVLRFQHSATDAALRSAVSRADDVSDPPNGSWLVVVAPGGDTQISPGAPRLLPYRPPITVVANNGPAITTDAQGEGGEYRILTTKRDGRIVQAATSLSAEHAERGRLLAAIAAAGAFAIVAAGLLGAIAGRRSVKPLADALARQRAFVADASHELRTPLTHLTTRAQLLERSLNSGDVEAARQASKRLVLDGKELAATLEDLLVAAEPTEPADWVTTDLVAVAEAGADAVAEAARLAEVTVCVESAAGTGEAAGGVPDQPRVRAPGTALNRALLALLDNAIRHTSPRGTVTLVVTADRRWACLTVTDTGPGIPAPERDRILNRFSHGKAAHSGDTRRFGLGLALVADTAERLGGDLVVSSELGHGTSMTIRLPRLL